MSHDNCYDHNSLEHDIDIHSGDRLVIDQYSNTTYFKNWKTTRLDYDHLAAACQIRGQNNNEI